ncbi:sigma-70 family RNA polymerase sigma factor [Ruminococcaceae bacterium OttesenSCG-928-D13]|nr:sigma-70 family RNA polymerase sigma factor [Ruminococcaceae bacterium OttesenSCG-928-D13]
MVECVKKAKQGDKSAFETLYKDCTKLVHFTALKILGPAQEQTAADITQETFLAAWQNIGKVKDGAAFPAWVKQIAANLTAQELRRKKEVLHPGGEDDAVKDIAADAAAEPHSVADKKSTQAIVAGLIDKLPADQRAVVVMYYFSGMKVKDICAATGQQSTESVKSQLHRARGNLKEAVKAIEKAGNIKLHSVGGAAISAALAAEAASTAAPATLSLTTAGTVTAAANTVATSTAGAVGGVSIAAKVVATVLVCVGVAGGSFGAYAAATAETVTLESVTITEPASPITTGESMQLDYAVGVSVDKSQYTLPSGKAVEGMSDKARGQIDGFVYEWSSDTSEVATVEGGNVTAIGNGVATITLTVSHGESQQSASITVEVVTSVKDISMPAELILNRGESGSVAATITPNTASNTGVVYESSDPNIASVDAAGNVEGITAGVCQVKASSAENPAIYALCEVTVHQPPESISLSTEETQVQAGRSGTLEITITPDYEEITVDFEINADSSDTSILMLNPQDNIVTITGVKQGTATVTVTLLVDGKVVDTAECLVTVTAAPRTGGGTGGSGANGNGGTGGSGGSGGGTDPAPGGGDGGGGAPAPSAGFSAWDCVSVAAEFAASFTNVSNSSTGQNHAGWSCSMFSSLADAQAMVRSQCSYYAGIAATGVSASTLHYWVSGDTFYVGLSFAANDDHNGLPGGGAY